MIRAIESVAARITGFIALLGGCLIVVMMVQVSLDVFLKYTIAKPIPSTLELVSAYYMVALVWLPLGAVTRDHEHLEVELFTQHLSERPLTYFKLFGCTVGAIYAGFMCWEGLQEAIHKTHIGEVWETATFDIPVWAARWFYPIGTFFASLYLTIYALDNLAFLVKGERLVPDRSIGSAIDNAIADAERATGHATHKDDGNIGVGRGGGSAD